MKTDYQTKHLNIRMNHRGISKEMIDFTLQYGKIIGDKYITNKKIICNLLNGLDKKIKKLKKLKKKFNTFQVSKLVVKNLKKLQNIRKVALKIMDKGGITVIYESRAIITTYNTDSYHKY